MKFFATNVNSATSYSSGVLNSIPNLFRTGPDPDATDEPETMEVYGVGKATRSEIGKLQMKYGFAEDFR